MRIWSTREGAGERSGHQSRLGAVAGRCAAGRSRWASICARANARAVRRTGRRHACPAGAFPPRPRRPHAACREGRNSPRCGQSHCHRLSCCPRAPTPSGTPPAAGSASVAGEDVAGVSLSLSITSIAARLSAWDGRNQAATGPEGWGGQTLRPRVRGECASGGVGRVSGCGWGVGEW